MAVLHLDHSDNSSSYTKYEHHGHSSVRLGGQSYQQPHGEAGGEGWTGAQAALKGAVGRMGVHQYLPRGCPQPPPTLPPGVS